MAGVPGLRGAQRARTYAASRMVELELLREDPFFHPFRRMPHCNVTA